MPRKPHEKRHWRCPLSRQRYRIPGGWRLTSATFGRKLWLPTLVGVLLLLAFGLPDAEGSGAPLTANAVYRDASPSVVTLIAKNELGTPIGLGSGFVLNDSLVRTRYVDAAVWDRVAQQQSQPQHVVYVVTNQHVINAAVGLEVRTADGATGWVQEVVTEDAERDVAILCAMLQAQQAPKGLSLHVDSPDVGEPVFAIGSPKGLTNTLSAGIVSGKRQIGKKTALLQMTAPISPGSSGGPVLSADGRVVGIATAVHSDGQNLNFATPVATVVDLLKQPLRTRDPAKGRSIDHERASAFMRATLASHRIDLPASERTAAQWLCDANELLQQQKYAEALQMAERAATDIPDNLECLLHFTSARASLGLAFQDQANALNRGSLGGAATIEALFRQSRHTAIALNSAVAAVREEPDFAPAQELLVDLAIRSGTWPEALVAADRLVRLVPQCSVVYQQRAKCYSELERPAAATQDLVQATRLDPANGSAFADLGGVYNAQGDYTKAVEAYRSAIEVKYGQPKSQADSVLGGMIWFNLANACEKIGRLQDAIVAYRQARTAPVPTAVREDAHRRIARCEALLRR